MWEKARSSQQAALRGGSGQRGAAAAAAAAVKRRAQMGARWVLVKAGQTRSTCPTPQVLSVDDDPVNQMVIQTMLTKAGFRVLKAPDGQKALDMLEVGAAPAPAFGKPPA